MKTTIGGVIDRCMELVLVLFFAGIGGSARSALRPDHTDISLRGYVGALLISGCAGLIVFHACKACRINENLSVAIVIIFGVVADDVLRGVVSLGQDVGKNPSKLFDLAGRFWRGGRRKDD